MVLQRLNSAVTLIQRTTTEAPQETYVLHRTGRSQEDDQLLRQGCEWPDPAGRQDRINAKRAGLLDEDSASAMDVGMEATIFTGWIYDHLLPHAEQMKVAHPLMLRAIAAAKKKNDRIDAGKIADCLRCDFLPECHMASRDAGSPPHLALPASVGAPDGADEEPGLWPADGDRREYNKQRLHKVGYFRELLSTNEEVHASIRPLLRLSRETIERCQRTEYALVSSLQRDPMLADRIRRLRTIPGVGPITALTWALEIGDVSRFRTIKKAISYCGLCGDERSSADKAMRMPLSKQRNKHIQRTLVEAAKLAPRQSHELAVIYEREKQKGNGNRATLAVARKMVAYLLAVDREREFIPAEERRTAAA